MIRINSIFIRQARFPVKELGGVALAAVLGDESAAAVRHGITAAEGDAQQLRAGGVVGPRLLFHAILVSAPFPPGREVVLVEVTLLFGWIAFKREAPVRWESW